MKPINKIIFVDIDDTLVRSFGSKRMPMTQMVEKVRELSKHGAVLYCWSSGGADYARDSARELGIEECFQGYLPKPHLLIDDVSVSKWKIRELHPNECLSLKAEEILTLI